MSPWPFAKWAIDLIGPLLKAQGQIKYAVVAIDYYTKWVEAEPLAKIIEQKTIKQTLKKKLSKLKGSWMDELSLVFWSYQTSFRTTTGETPFSLYYGVDAVVPVNLNIPTYRIKNFDEASNDELLALETNLLEEK
ncbi:hypothetical protein UlMin_013673 [Ulmus minor]